MSEQPLKSNEPEVKGITTKPRDVKRTPPGPDAEDIVVCKGVHKWFGELHVLNDININVKHGEVLVIAGPSGSGKSTWIRCINRLEEHQRGDIIIDGIELSNDIRNIAAIRSEIGMVFQQFNLFPHLTVLDNIVLGTETLGSWLDRDGRFRRLALVTVDDRGNPTWIELRGSGSDASGRWFDGNGGDIRDGEGW